MGGWVTPARSLGTRIFFCVSALPTFSCERAGVWAEDNKFVYVFCVRKVSVLFI